MLCRQSSRHMTTLAITLSFSWSRPTIGLLPVSHGVVRSSSSISRKTAVSSQVEANSQPTASQPTASYSVIFLRHGQSEWNLERRFVGWVDSPLTDTGIAEAKAAGAAIRASNRTLDVVFTSFLRRAVKTAYLVLDASDHCHIPVLPQWRLNERHVGCLVGHTMDSAIAAYGHDRVRTWRTTLDVRPDPMEPSHPLSPAADLRRYGALPPDAVPRAECLLDVRARAAACWEEVVAPAMRAGRRVAVVAHENSLRALLMHVDPDVAALGVGALSFEVPRATPLVYEFDEAMRPVRHPAALKPLRGWLLGPNGQPLSPDAAAAGSDGSALLGPAAAAAAGQTDEKTAELSMDAAAGFRTRADA